MNITNNKQTTILIIEDNSSLIRGLKDAFVAKGYKVIVALDGETGAQLALTEQPDLVLLDIMLPKKNGFEVCYEIREAEREFPIIMLTAKNQEQDIVRGLNLGADDYVTKPFSIVELLARANAFLRRKQTQSHFQFDDIEVNFTSNTVTRAKQPVKLTPKEYGLLCYFIKKEGRALTRDNILNAVWNSTILTTSRSVDRCITTLRKKIEKEPSKPKYIHSIQGVGYKFISG
jgi:DNA-binding response OmpR family regulator